MSALKASSAKQRSEKLNNTDRPTLAKSLTLAATSLGYCVVELDVTIVNTALKSIGASLGGGVTELQWVVSAYTIAFAALILTAGALGDRVGAKKVFMAGFTDYLRDTSTRRSDNDCDRRPQSEEIIFQSLTRIGTFKFWRKMGVIESLFRFRHQTKRPFRGRAGR